MKYQWSQSRAECWLKLAAAAKVCDVLQAARAETFSAEIDYIFSGSKAAIIQMATRRCTLACKEETCRESCLECEELRPKGELSEDVSKILQMLDTLWIGIREALFWFVLVMVISYVSCSMV